MPDIYPLSYSHVVKIAARNRSGVWHRAGAAVDDPEGAFAFQRLQREIFEPKIEASFSIPRDSKFFTIGSCFARGLENALHGAGFAMLSRSEKFNAFETIGDGVSALGCTNRYNTGSIANEFRWALEPTCVFPEDAIIDLPDGLSSDPHMTPTLKLTDHEGTLKRRNIFTSVARSVAEADVIIITLGLTEVWRDTKTGLVTNTAPDGKVATVDRDRFVFDILRYQENIDNLEAVYALLQKFGKPGHKIIVTVSPVALARTFTDQDVVIANSYSKSTLRAVATDFVARHDNVDYFPAYEIVMNSDVQATWIEDRRHPKGMMGQHIIRTFVREYIENVPEESVTLDVGYVA